MRSLEHLAGPQRSERPLLPLLTSSINVKASPFFARGDGIADDTAAIQAAVTAAAGSPVFCPAGQYRVTSAITNVGGIPMYIFGIGNGAGPGAAAQLNSNVTQFIMDSDANDLFVVSSFSPSIFRDFQVNKSPAHRPGTGGIAIKLIGTGTGGVGIATVANYKIENVGFTNIYTPIRVLRPAWGVTRGCYFDTWANAAIYLETSAGIEGSGGHIVNCFLFGTSAYGSPAIYSEVGYTVVNANEVLGGSDGIQFNIKNFDAGFIKVTNNTIENFGAVGVRVQRGDATSLSTMLMIQNNEFSSVDGVSLASIAVVENTTTPVWIKDITISGNVSRNNMGSVNDKHIWVMAGQNVQVYNNVIQELGANNPTGIQVSGATINTGLAAPFNVYDNIIVGTTNKYSFAANPALQLRDLAGMTVAALPANLGDGSQVYTTDAIPGTNPLLAGGTGTMALRAAGVWASMQNSGFVLLTSGTISNQATLDLVLTTFTAYRGIVIELRSVVPATDNSDLWMRFSTNGGGAYDAGATDYNYSNSLTESVGPSVTAQGSNGAAQITMNRDDSGVGNQAAEGITMTVKLMNQTSAAQWSRVTYDGTYIDNQATQRVWRVAGSGARRAAQDTDAVRFLFDSGNLSTGTYAVYGLL
jgi:hypothetical protein